MQIFKILFLKKNLQIPQGKSESVNQRRTDKTMAKRYHRGNQNPYIEEEQTTQWQKDTTGVIRIRISKKNRQHNGQKIPQG
jgi:hypothetical protein